LNVLISCDNLGRGFAPYITHHRLSANPDSLNLLDFAWRGLNADALC
jgi:hypothetical protein